MVFTDNGFDDGRPYPDPNDRVECLMAAGGQRYRTKHNFLRALRRAKAQADREEMDRYIDERSQS